MNNTPRAVSRVRPAESIDRRTVLKQAGALALCAGLPRLCLSAERGGPFSADAQQIVARYLESLARPDGGYGWPEQHDSFLSVTFAVVGAYRALGLPVPRPQETAAMVRRGHPTSGPTAETQKHWADPKEFLFQQIQTLVWLGEEVAGFRRGVQGWKSVSSYVAYYEKGENPILRQEVQPILCRELLGLPMDDLPAAFADYLAARRRADGSFNNTPASDGSGGHLVNTFFCLRARRAMALALSPEVADWIDRCQTACGGFTWSPSPAIGAVEDVSYVWAAVHALALLGRKPARAAACVDWLRSLWNEDGGFADRPGAASTAMATFQAIDALRVLDASVSGTRRKLPKPRSLPADLQAFSLQIQAPGHGSIVEAVEMARLLRIHLWGAKNSSRKWVDRAQTLARQRGVPVTFFPSNEEYGTRVNVPGLGNYSHVNDPITAPGQSLTAWPRREGSWEQFQAEKMTPLHQGGGRMVWQICDNEEFARILLDESLLHGGYDMISSFHFGDYNMAWTVPAVLRYQHDIPLVALQDAHNEAWWWSGNLAGFRTVFLAKEPTWDGWLEALREKRLVAVRRDAQTRNRLRVLGGSAEVRRMVLDRSAQWQWWDDNGTVLDRAPASVVALDPKDEFEPGRPDRGMALRIRMRRRCSFGALQQPLVDCEAVLIDGRDVKAEKIETRSGEKTLMDVYLLVRLDPPAPGEHTVELRLVELASGRRFGFTQKLGFNP